VYETVVSCNELEGCTLQGGSSTAGLMDDEGVTRVESSSES